MALGPLKPSSIRRGYPPPYKKIRQFGREVIHLIRSTRTVVLTTTFIVGVGLNREVGCTPIHSPDLQIYLSRKFYEI